MGNVKPSLYYTTFLTKLPATGCTIDRLTHKISFYIKLSHIPGA